MSGDRNLKTEQEPKLGFAKGCLWSILISVPFWALLIWWLFVK
ncbi:hypothetical protein ACFQZT_31605 [Paenibacillus sp. GCM10027628]